MHINGEAISFIRECIKYRNGKIWMHEFDDQYNLKYSFYFGEPNYNIISPFTLFEYGRKIVTFSQSALEELFREELNLAKKGNLEDIK